MITLLEGDLDLAWFVDTMASKQLGCDIETSGLNKQTDKIACIQIYTPGIGTVMVRNLSKKPEKLIKLLQYNKVQKIFHYGYFDLSFLVRDYPALEPANIADTKIAAKILDPKKQLYNDPITGKPSHSLRSLIYNHFGVILDKTLAISDWFAPDLSTEQLDYAAKDVEYLPLLLGQLEYILRQRRKIRLVRQAYAHLPTKVILDMRVGDVYSYE
ncbi:MAG TPA: ribonuclease H-like domain-containing protein [Nitrososphaeraceae archaeon]|nr:ribonuclease H-like domain-containing protein [Nitrososphaeraceae archaeon]